MVEMVPTGKPLDELWDLWGQEVGVLWQPGHVDSLEGLFKLFKFLWAKTKTSSFSRAGFPCVLESMNPGVGRHEVFKQIQEEGCNTGFQEGDTRVLWLRASMTPKG